jgi:hypothetical protein
VVLAAIVQAVPVAPKLNNAAAQVNKVNMERTTTASPDRKQGTTSDGEDYHVSNLYCIRIDKSSISNRPSHGKKVFDHATN